MVRKRTAIIVIIAIILAIAVSMIMFKSDPASAPKDAQKYNLVIDQNSTNIKVSLTSDEETPAPQKIAGNSSQPRPVPAVVIITPTPIASPIMKNIPGISIDGPIEVATGDKFILEFQVNPNGENIVGLGVDVTFDGNLVEAKKVDILNLGEDENDISFTGEIGSGFVSNIAITKRSGISERFMAIEFDAIKQGKVNINANITAINDVYAEAEILHISKYIQIQ